MNVVAAARTHVTVCQYLTGMLGSHDGESPTSLLPHSSAVLHYHNSHTFKLNPALLAPVRQRGRALPRPLSPSPLPKRGQSRHGRVNATREDVVTQIQVPVCDRELHTTTAQWTSSATIAPFSWAKTAPILDSQHGTHSHKQTRHPFS